MKIANIDLQVFGAKKYNNTKYNHLDVSRNILETPDYDTFFRAKNFSLEDIFDLFFSFQNEAYIIKTLQQTRVIDEILGQKRPDEFELRKILELTQEEKISALALYGIVTDTQISKEVSSDIQKMLFASKNKIDIKELFCPEYKNLQQADKNAVIGDVFHLSDDDFVKIKTSRGIEDLFISKEVYMELFPPIERFGAVQSASGDCYLLSFFASIFQNPNKRDFILKMFKENPDESIDCAFCGYKKDEFGNVQLRDKSAFELKNADKILSKEMKIDQYVYAIQPEGFRLIELLWDKNLQSQTFNKIKERRALFKKNLFFKLNFADDIKYSFFEKLDFLKLTRNIENAEFDEKYLDFYPLDAFEIDVDKVKNFIKIAKQLKKQGVNPDGRMSNLELDYFLQILNRQLSFYEKNNCAAQITEFLSKNCYETLFGETDSYLNMTGESTWVAQVLGLDLRRILLKDNLHFLEHFVDYEYNPNKYILTCAINDNPTRSPFEVNFHEYACDIKEEDGKKVVVVRNPYNMMFEKIYSLEEFAKTFKILSITEL